MVKYAVSKSMGQKNVSDQNHDFHLANLNQIDINYLVKVYSKKSILGF